MENEFLKTEEEIVKMLRTVYDPEIPVNIYDLGLIYKVEVDDGRNVEIDMTFIEDVRQKVSSIDGVRNAQINIVFEPEWNKDMMSEEAKLELGLL